MIICWVWLNNLHFSGMRQHNFINYIILYKIINLFDKSSQLFIIIVVLWPLIYLCISSFLYRCLFTQLQIASDRSLWSVFTNLYTTLTNVHLSLSTETASLPMSSYFLSRRFTPLYPSNLPSLPLSRHDKIENSGKTQFLFILLPTEKRKFPIYYLLDYHYYYFSINTLLFMIRRLNYNCPQIIQFNIQ